MPAIKLDNVRGGTFENVHISGFDVGIESVNSSFTARGMTFDGVRQPWDVRGGDFAQVENTRIINDPKVTQQATEHKNKNHSFSGWRRNGPPIPSQCPHCKTVFPSRNFDFGTARFLSKNNEETCRECRREGAKLADGLFDLTAEAVRIIRGPDITYAMLAALGQIASDVESGRISPEDVVPLIAGVDPRLGKIAQQISEFGSTGLNYLSFAIGVASLVVAYVSLDVSKQSLTLSQEQTSLAREQTDIAREGLKLQKEAPSQDDTLKAILKKMEDLKFVPSPQVQTQSDPGDQQPSAGPTQTKAPTETGSVNLKPESAPKHKRIRRHGGTGHRYILHCCCKPSPSRH